ncbi:MAG: SDR family NAD(P)-dependent oxidoreductase, partial [Alphaproteobacteria bacterium]
MSKPVAIVVGAGPGLGSALARRFAEAGMAVAVARRNGGTLSELATEIGGKAYSCDATDAGAVEDVFATVTRDLGPPALAVYNAGAYQPGGILEIDPRDFEACWRIGCLGGLHVGQAALKRMVPAGAGTIIYTGATASLRGGSGFANLAVPKFGLRALAQSMAREFGPKGIHVAHTIIDGQIAGERPGHRPEERGADALLAPSAIAEAYLRLHEQPRSAWTQ